MKKLGKTGIFLSDRLLLPTILAQWHQPVASVVALDSLYWAMCAVLYRRTAAAIKMASLFGTFFTVVSFAIALAATGVIWSE
jgi:hypothetical protein